MVISYATMSLVFHLIVTGITVNDICEALNLKVNRGTAARVRQPRVKTTDPNVAAPDKKISSYTFTYQKSLLSRPVKTKHGPDPGQQNPQVGSLESIIAPPQDWQSLVDLSVFDDKRQTMGLTIFINCFTKCFSTICSQFLVQQQVCVYCTVR